MAEAEVEGAAAAAAGGGRGVAEDDGASSSSAAAAVTSPLRASFLSAFVSDDSAISAANSAALNRSERGETRGLCEKRGGKREKRERCNLDRDAKSSFSVFFFSLLHFSFFL